ncbi:alanine--tRNA ligase [Buchnera aphidicola (Hyadaphis tataricae)]|uniref:Alanine--tRNA ligase n=1 Tax=Buchnera aphidicola (Hyadaphis tataricae) TaxID=1241859 RepID=A0A4D6Y5P0_9GAMM|nr:alanine--tRNA ligase [Buchnera aphidicola]QCI21694.1 alanine--tRNA ligase [Buchnera aphidicola (Hyadaphis tataricae)]
MHKKTNKIRQDFLTFFKEKNHVILPSSSLIPYNDSTLLFTNAGMNQFKEIFLGQKNTHHLRVATVQRCLRTGGKHNDLDNVGYTSKHHTFFEMLGNFSFGDYFKKEAIEYAWELLTSEKWFNIPKKKLWISVYEQDYESYEIWKNIIHINPEKIIKIGDKEGIKYNSDNFWKMGDTGPCGPSTEIFYDYGNENENTQSSFIENKNNRFVEIWNIVFISFNRISKNKIISLPKISVDTGMGLERIAAVLQNVSSNYDIDIFQVLIKHISTFSTTKCSNHISLKIIADHIRSAVYMIADDVLPSNEHRGYVLRRIIRRALRHGQKIGIKEHFFYKLVSTVINTMHADFHILQNKKETIQSILKKEETQFSATLKKGLKILDYEIKNTKNDTLSGKTIFYLYDTFGFPVDLTNDICREKNIKIDYQGYKILKEKQKKRSFENNQFCKNYNNDIVINDTCLFKGYKEHKTKSLVKNIAAKNKFVQEISNNDLSIIFLNITPFYSESGGQISDIGKLYNKNACFIVENTKKYGNTIGHIGRLIFGKIKIYDRLYSQIDREHRNDIQLNHSSTHLLHATLREIFGSNVYQKGSLVTNKYLRFDFSYSNSITIAQIQNIENIVNAKIRDNIPIEIKELSLEEAKKKKAMCLFDNAYSSIVRVVFIKDFSIELCGGTHTKRTGDIGFFKIISRSSVSSGIKRIEAITGQTAINFLHKKENDIHDISTLLNCDIDYIKEKITKLINTTKHLETKITTLQHQENISQIKNMMKRVIDIKGVKFLSKIFYNYEHKSMRIMLDQLKKLLKVTIVILINIINHRFTIIVGVTKNLINDINAKKIIDKFMEKTLGKGGGKKDIAEGGGKNTKKIPEILNDIEIWIGDQLKNSC